MNKLNAHDRDKNISFVSEGHKYTIGDGSISYTSVSTFVKSLFPTFNSDFVLQKMRKSPNWNESHKHYGKTDEEIKIEWSNKCIEASTKGTGLHEAIDKYLNGELEKEPELEEWGYFKKFMSTFKPKPYRTEWMIYDEDNQICGTLDMLAKNDDGTYTIVDWKRSKSIFMPRHNIISNTTYWHYSLQLNLYKYILERHYNIKVSKLLIVQMHPAKKELKVYEMQPRQYEIKRYLQEKKGYLH